LIVCTPPPAMPNLIVSRPALAFACSMAARSVQPPPVAMHVLSAVFVSAASLVLSTVKVSAPAGPARSASTMAVATKLRIVNGSFLVLPTRYPGSCATGAGALERRDSRGSAPSLLRHARAVEPIDREAYRRRASRGIVPP